MDELFAEIKQFGPKDPSTLDKFTFECFNEFGRRNYFNKKYSWAVPSKDVVQKISNFIESDKCLEIGVGSGLWSYLLKLNVVDILPTDSNQEKFDKYYIDFEKIDGNAAIHKYQDRNVLFLCWSRIDPTKNFKGNKIIYIGEGEDGCTNGIPNLSPFMKEKINF